MEQQVQEGISHRLGESTREAWDLTFKGTQSPVSIHGLKLIAVPQEASEYDHKKENTFSGNHFRS